MNNDEMNSPFYGSMSDINVWNRMLTDDESSGWMNCKLSIDDGKIFRWKNLTASSLNLTGVKMASERVENVCSSNFNKDHLIATNYKMSFWQTNSFCKRFGSMAVVRDNITAYKFQDAMKRSSCDKFGAFTGYTDLYEEGNFVEFGSKSRMAWSNWDPDFSKETISIISS